MSPGPSLAVVIHNTLHGDRLSGVLTALSHATGVAVYALLTTTGLAVVITQTPQLFDLIRWAGAVFLFVFGARSLLGNSSAKEAMNSNEPALRSTHFNSIRSGFLISLLNPKLAIFFLALFSQYVQVDSGWGQKAVLVSTVTVIDGAWYCLVALALSHSSILEKLRRQAPLLDKIFGLILIAIAIRVVL